MSLKLKHLKIKLYIVSWFNIYYWRNLKGRFQRWNRRRIAYKKINAEENIIAISLYEMCEVGRKAKLKARREDSNAKWKESLNTLNLKGDLPQRESIITKACGPRE